MPELSIDLGRSTRLLEALTFIHASAALAVVVTTLPPGVKGILLAMCLISGVYHWQRFFLCSLAIATSQFCFNDGLWVVCNRHGGQWNYNHCTVSRLGFCLVLRWTEEDPPGSRGRPRVPARMALVAADAMDSEQYRRLLRLLNRAGPGQSNL